MIYSNNRSCAIRAIARLAMIRPQGTILPEELCKGTDLPMHAADMILQDLVRRGLLTSVNGPGGGFALARKPSEITIDDIMQALNGVQEEPDASEAWAVSATTSLPNSRPM